MAIANTEGDMNMVFVAHAMVIKSAILFQNAGYTSAKAAVIKRLLQQERFFIKHISLQKRFWTII